MENVIVPFLLVFAGVILVAVAVHAIVIAHYRPIQRHSTGRADAVSRLVVDIQAAERSIVVACEDEDCVVGAEGAPVIEAALREAKGRVPTLHVEFVWGGPPETLPPFIARWAHDNLVVTEFSRGPLPFTGRVVDDKVVEIYGPSRSPSRSRYTRVRRAAPGVASRLIEVARAA